MNKIFAFIISIIFITIGCDSTKKVVRTDATSQTDLSGRWNETDSRLVAQEMVTDGLSRNWLLEFVEAKSKKPIIIVGTIKNKTSEHISAETFISDIEREFINSGKVKVVQGGKDREELRDERADQNGNSTTDTAKKWGREKGADFILQGTINSITDSNSKMKTVFYQVDLYLSDLESNEKVWIGDKKIKKVIK